MKKSLGVYLHIPFCIKKCGYCDFCSFPAAEDKYADKYTSELCRRIAQSGQMAENYTVDTVYFGGGTPSLLSSEKIKDIMNTVSCSFELSSNAEITLECNPATVDGEYFEQIREIAVNRLSIGLQSAKDSELYLLGRAHSAEDFVKCFRDARRAGFDNISADLMYGIPDQTLESLAFSVDFLTDLSPEHISAYGLTVEEGTRFWHQREMLRLADDDTQAEMYALCSQKLEGAGYEKYEISNFARNGMRSRHNMRYWQGLEYLGFGVAAHSYFASRRYGNSRDIEAFIRGEDITSEQEYLTPNAIREEYVMLGLRLTDGIDTAEYAKIFANDFHADFPMVDKWVKKGFMNAKNGRISFTEKGFLVSNSLLSEMLSFD